MHTAKGTEMVVVVTTHTRMRLFPSPIEWSRSGDADVVSVSEVFHRPKVGWATVSETACGSSKANSNISVIRWDLAAQFARPCIRCFG